MTSYMHLIVNIIMYVASSSYLNHLFINVSAVADSPSVAKSHAAEDLVS